MTTRYSGDVKVNITWNEKQNQYRARVSAPGCTPVRVTVNASEHLEVAVDSSEAYDAAAREAISSAETELFGTGVSVAAYRIEQVYVGRSLEKRWPPEMSTLELDTWGEKELMEFWSYVSRHPVKAGREFFPNRPPKYSTVANDLAAYASNRATMLACKRRGDKHGAATYEFICNTIRWALPLWII